MSEQEERELDLLVQQYLDGDLPGREGTRLLLEAESDARLSNELSGYRRLYSLLDTMPRSEPSADYDRRIFESIPRERYASAPRRVWPTLVTPFGGGFAPARSRPKMAGMRPRETIDDEKAS